MPYHLTNKVITTKDIGEYLNVTAPRRVYDVTTMLEVLGWLERVEKAHSTYKWTENGRNGLCSLFNITKPQRCKDGLAQTTFSLFRDVAGGFKELRKDELFDRTAAARRNYTVINIAEGMGIIVRSEGANKTLRVWDKLAWMSNTPLHTELPKLTIQRTLEEFLSK